MKKEIWKEIPGYDGRYEVSNYGRVRSHYGKTKFLRGKIDTDGHVQQRLFNKSGSKYLSVHRLVLDAFVGECPEGMECCHNDGKPAHNHLSNLRWDTHQNNMKDSIKHGTSRAPKGENNGNAILREEDVRWIKKNYKKGVVGLREIAGKFDVSMSCVNRVIIGKTWVGVV